MWELSENVTSSPSTRTPLPRGTKEGETHRLGEPAGIVAPGELLGDSARGAVRGEASQAEPAGRAFPSGRIDETSFTPVRENGVSGQPDPAERFPCATASDDLIRVAPQRERQRRCGRWPGVVPARPDYAGCWCRQRRERPLTPDPSPHARRGERGVLRPIHTRSHNPVGQRR